MIKSYTTSTTSGTSCDYRVTYVDNRVSFGSFTETTNKKKRPDTPEDWLRGRVEEICDLVDLQ